MRTLSVLALLLLGACSSGGRQVAEIGCGDLGFAPGSAGYAACLQNADIHRRVLQRSYDNPTVTAAPASVVQQYTRGQAPIVNCTSYAVPISGSPTLCD